MPGDNITTTVQLYNDIIIIIIINVIIMIITQWWDYLIIHDEQLIIIKTEITGYITSILLHLNFVVLTFCRFTVFNFMHFCQPVFCLSLVHSAATTPL